MMKTLSISPEELADLKTAILYFAGIANAVDEALDDNKITPKEVIFEIVPSFTNLKGLKMQKLRGLLGIKLRHLDEAQKAELLDYLHKSVVFQNHPDAEYLLETALDLAVYFISRERK